MRKVFKDELKVKACVNITFHQKHRVANLVIAKDGMVLRMA